MNKESFNQLLELQSCEKKIKDLQLKINEENKRISFVQINIDRNLDQIVDKKNLLKQYKSQSIKLDHYISEVTQKIERAHQNINNASTQAQVDASEKELNTLRPLLEESESDIIKIWEDSELLEAELDETEGFEEGSKNSLEMLRKEVSSITEDYEKEINIVNLRKKDLFLGIDNNTSKVFQQLESNKHPAVTFMEKNRCNSCMTQLDQSLISAINSMRSLEFCPTCGRILVSLEVRY